MTSFPKSHAYAFLKKDEVSYLPTATVYHAQVPSQTQPTCSRSIFPIVAWHHQPGCRRAYDFIRTHVPLHKVPGVLGLVWDTELAVYVIHAYS